MFKTTTNKERDQLRKRILRFCSTPKTHSEVAAKYGISGMSAANYLSDLSIKNMVKTIGKKGRYYIYLRCKRRTKK